jgi:hypothetical protein
VRLVRGAAAAGAILVAACSGGGRPDGPADGAVSTTSDGAPYAMGDEVGADEAAALAFIEAWRRGEVEAMRRVGAAAQVDAAMRLGRALGVPDCSTQSSGQFQCVINVSRGTPAYLLVGGPGDRAGRVWWVAEYVPGT